ncbi:MAG TPA: RNA polymerase sigma factor [Planctomycetota bacterium]|nr:RNA polymerase sigma factor [Planctomycetota bacterium]
MTHAELETLVRMHQAEVYRYVRYLGAESTSVAEDLAQETFLAAFRSRDLDAPRDERKQSAWLRGIARNLFLMHCRRSRSNPVHADSASLEQAEQIWKQEFLREGDGFETIEALRRCLETLGEKQRRMLKLHYAENKSRSELAELFAMSEDGIKSLMRRLRGALAQCIRRRLEAQ